MAIAESEHWVSMAMLGIHAPGMVLAKLGLTECKHSTGKVLKFLKGVEDLS